MLYEHRSEALLPRAAFYRRVLRHAAAGALILAVSLAIGMLGYHFIEGLGWVDAGVPPDAAQVPFAGEVAAVLHDVEMKRATAWWPL